MEAPAYGASCDLPPPPGRRKPVGPPVSLGECRGVRLRESQRRMRKYLIWDFDGTLGYRQGGWTATLLDIVRLEAPACAATAEQVRAHLQAGFPWHTPDRPHPAIISAGTWWDALDTVFEQAFQALGIGALRAQRMARQVRRIYPDPTYWRLFEDTLPGLQQLSTEGWTHVMLSNHAPELRAILRQLRLEGYFAAILNSAETGYEKPHPQAFRQVLAALGSPSRIWMIGDSTTADIAGAEAVGIPGILVRRHHPQATYCCQELAQISAIVNGG